MHAHHIVATYWVTLRVEAMGTKAETHLSPVSQVELKVSIAQKQKGCHGSVLDWGSFVP